jgi:hypothetical protein
MLTAVVLLSACTGSGSPASPPPPSSPSSTQSPPSTGNEPVKAVVSTCTGPTGASGTTVFSVGYRMPGVTDPIHLVHVNGFTAYDGSKQVNVTPVKQEVAGPEDRQTFSGPRFDRLVLIGPSMGVDAQPTVHADSVEKLQGMRFSGPFGPARITTVNVHGQKVSVKVSSAKRAMAGVQNLGPQDAALQVGSATMSLKGTSSGVAGSQNVSQLVFEGPHPGKGAATLTMSAWKILDFGNMTIALPADC